MSSPTSRSLETLRSAGYAAEVVEKWNPHSRTRKDLFGFIDILAVRQGETLAVQTTSKSNMSARIRKIADAETLAAVREAGWSIVVHGWAKDKQGHWKLTVANVS